MNVPVPVHENANKRPDNMPAFPDEISHLDEIEGRLDEANKQMIPSSTSTMNIRTPSGTWFNIAEKSTPTKCSRTNWR